jgi:hypothetical protein
VNDEIFYAILALDVTAPVEFALATLFDRRLERVVNSSAQHMRLQPSIPAAVRLHGLP